MGSGKTMIIPNKAGVYPGGDMKVLLTWDDKGVYSMSVKAGHHVGSGAGAVARRR